MRFFVVYIEQYTLLDVYFCRRFHFFYILDRNVFKQGLFALSHSGAAAASIRTELLRGSTALVDVSAFYALGEQFLMINKIV